jgi:hypothetical protein
MYAHCTDGRVTVEMPIEMTLCTKYILHVFSSDIQLFISKCTVVDQNKMRQSKFRLCNSIFLRNPSLRKQVSKINKFENKTF